MAASTTAVRMDAFFGEMPFTLDRQMNLFDLDALTG